MALANRKLVEGAQRPC